LESGGKRDFPTFRLLYYLLYRGENRSLSSFSIQEERLFSGNLIAVKTLLANSNEIQSSTAVWVPQRFCLFPCMPP